MNTTNHTDFKDYLVLSIVVSIVSYGLTGLIMLIDKIPEFSPWIYKIGISLALASTVFVGLIYVASHFLSFNKNPITHAIYGKLKKKMEEDTSLMYFSLSLPVLGIIGQYHFIPSFMLLVLSVSLVEYFLELYEVDLKRILK